MQHALRIARRFRILSAALAFFVLTQALAPAAIFAAHDARARTAEVEALAARLGVDREFVASPEAYLDRQRVEAEQRQAAALAELDREARPDPARLAQARAAVAAARAAHAASAFGGLPNTLDSLAGALIRARESGAVSLPAGEQAAYRVALASSRSDLARLASLERERIDPNLQPRLDAFVSQMSDAIAAAERAMADSVSSASALPEIRQGFTADPPLYDKTGAVRSLAGAPAGSRLEYGLEQRTFTAQDFVRSFLKDNRRVEDLVQVYKQIQALISAPTAPPVAADLAPNIDVQITQAITDLAISMGGRPLDLFNYVHDRFDTELYYGSKKGSLGTLLEAAGNDVDQASLLIALLRASGIPARYATGTVLLSEAQARDLARLNPPPGASSALSATNIILTSGIPAVRVINSDGTQDARIEHTWVQAWLPYDRYRGVADGGAAAPAWIDLDPFIKRYAFTAPTADLRAVVFNPVTYITSAPSTTLPIDYYIDQALTYARTSGLTCDTIDSAGLTRLLIPEGLELLPADLPVRLVTLLSTPSALPGAMRYSVGVRVLDEFGALDLSVSLNLPAIYGQRIDLSYPGATATDQTEIANRGGIFNTPPYLVNVRPTLKVNEQTVATAAPLRPGTPRILYVQFVTPKFTSDTPQISHNIAAGGQYVIGLDYQSTPQRVLDAAILREAQLNPASDDGKAQKLYGAILAYFRETNRGRDVALSVQQNGYIRDLGAGFASIEAVPTLVNGAPVALRFGGYQLDVAKLTHAFYDLESAKQTRSFAVAQAWGYNTSALEHWTLQQTYAKRSISSVSALQIAALQGQPILTITSAGQVAALGLSAQAKTNISNALARGRRALVSQNPISYGGWSGEGYVTYDPVLGSASYLISGNLNGGVTSDLGAPSMESVCGAGNGDTCPPSTYFTLLFYRITGLSGSVGDPVTLSNGNLTMEEVDQRVMAVGLPIGFIRFYNSLDAAAMDSRIGYGWSDSFSQHVVTGTAGARIYVQRDGHEYTFGADGGGGFIRPPGFFMSLTQSITGYVLADASGVFEQFDPSGRLIAMSNGTLTHQLIYSGTQLTTVQDATARAALSFGYGPNGRISQATDVDGQISRYGYDAAGNLVVVTATNGMTMTYGYDSAHRLASTRDPLGQVNLYEYDAQGRMQRHTDPLGQVESLRYDPANNRAVYSSADGQDQVYGFDNKGRLTSHTDGQGNKTRMAYNANDQVVQTTDPRGNASSAAFDANGNLIARADATGQTQTVTYNAQGQVISATTVVEGVPVTTRATYDANGYLLSEIDASGRGMTYTRDANGLVIGRIDSAGASVTFTYGPDGQVKTASRIVADVDGAPLAMTQIISRGPGGLATQVQGPNGRVFTIAPDASGRPQATAIDGRSAALQYDAAGRINQIADNRGYTQTMVYDAKGQIVAQEDSLGRKTFKEYLPGGRLAAQSDERGRVVRYVYDDLGRPVRTLLPDGTLVGTGYCAGDATPCKSVDALGIVTSRDTDPLGRVLTATNGLGVAAAMRYDGLGRQTRQIDPLGNITQFRYDGAGRLTRVIDPLGHQTIYNFDARGNLASLTDANGHSRTYAFDALGRVVRETDAAGRIAKGYYDAAGDLYKTVDPNNVATLYGYTPEGKPASLTTPDGVDLYAYDGMGRSSGESNAIAATSRAYDAQGRVVSETQVISGAARTLAYGYTPDGRMISMTLPGGATTTYGYDVMDRLSSITDHTGGVTTLSYDAGGRRTRLRLPNGVTTSYAWDNAYRLTAQITRNAAGVVLAAFSYSYDAANRRTSLTDMAGHSTTYAYDANSRLTAVAYGNGRTQSFTYDNVGNRLSQTVNGVTTTYSYDVADRLTSETTAGQTTTYAYDDNGNLLSRTSVAASGVYTFNQRNQLVGATAPGAGQWNFGYFPGGGRAFEQAALPGGGVQRTEFLNAGGSVAADYASDGSVSRYLRGVGVDEMFGFERNGVWTYVVQDPQGSAGALVDAGGNVIGRRSYDAFGAVLEQTGLWPTRYGYTGREDIGATGLMHYRSRAYDPRTGRFASSDSFAGRPEQPASLHRYTYTWNDPINHTDPSGADPGPGDPAIWFHSNNSFLQFIYDTWIVDTVKNAFKGRCVVGPICLIASMIITFYETYYGMIGSVHTLLFKYNNLPDMGAALSIVIGLWIPITGAAILLDLASQSGEKDVFNITNWKKEVMMSAAAKLAEFVAAYYKWPNCSDDQWIAGMCGFGYVVALEGIKFFARLGLGLAGDPMEGLKAGAADTIKLFLAPEVAIGIVIFARWLEIPPEPAPAP